MARSLAIYLFVLVIISGQGLFVKGADVYWRDYNGAMTSDAYSTGYNTFIGQVIYSDSLIPGTLYPDRKTVVFEFHGKKEVRNNIKYMCTGNPNSFKWQWVNTNHLDAQFLNKCIVGGHEEEVKLYIGKVFHEGEWKIGKVIPPNNKWNDVKGLYIWWNNGGTHTTQDFEILVEQ